MRGTAPAEAPADIRFVNVAFPGRQLGSGSGGAQRGFCILRRAPHLAFFGGPKRRRVHRLKRGVILMRVAVDRLEFGSGAGKGGLEIAVCVAYEYFVCGGEPLLQHLREGSGGRGLVRAFVPDDGKSVERRVRLPPAIGNHGDG